MVADCPAESLQNSAINDLDLPDKIALRDLRNLGAGPYLNDKMGICLTHHATISGMRQWKSIHGTSICRGLVSEADTHQRQFGLV